MSDERLAMLERQVAVLAGRITVLERLLDREPELPAPTVASPAPTRLAAFPVPPPDAVGAAVQGGPISRPAPEQPKRPQLNLEELLGGRLLALVGGVAFLLGIAFFVALAVERGWIGIGLRMVVAATVSTALFAGGVWLYERKGKTQAALGLVGTAVAALYLTITAAAAHYALISPVVALAAALLVGAIATATAVRWGSRTVAGLGIGGALLSPVVAGSMSTEAICFLAVAFSAASGVLVWRRWAWLQVAAFATTMIQLAIWVNSATPGLVVFVSVLAAFAVLNLVATVGYGIRLASAELDAPSILLAVSGALVFGGLGYIGLAADERVLAGGLWVGALAAAHGLAGGFAIRRRPEQPVVGLVLIGAGLALADVAFGLLAGGAVLAIGWALSALALAGALRWLARGRELLQLGLCAQLTLAIAHALLFDAAPSVGTGGSGNTNGIAAIGAVAVASFGAARLARNESDAGRRALDALSLAALAYSEWLAFDGVPFVAALVLSAVALNQSELRAQPLATIGAIVFEALAATYVLAVEAPPSSLVYGASHLGGAAVALVIVAAGLARLALTRSAAAERLALGLAGAAALVYLASIAIVTGFQPGPGVLDTGLSLEVRQQGQVLLSGFWGICGFATLWFGLRRDERPLRLVGFSFLALAVSKVFAYDLSTLASVYRVLSLVGVGLLLLVAALAYQRIRASGERAGDAAARLG